MKFHHIGIAVKDIHCALETYKSLGYNQTHSDIIFDSIQDVKLAFLEKENSPLIELVSPDSNKSPIAGILSKMGSSPYHTCYEVEDIKKSISFLRKNEFIAIGRIVPAIAFQNRSICFLYNINIGIIELLSK